jgi:hypothetical protein
MHEEFVYHLQSATGSDRGGLGGLVITIHDAFFIIFGVFLYFSSIFIY